jgi:hypothetical protein
MKNKFYKHPVIINITNLYRQTKGETKARDSGPVSLHAS